ncbi:MAG: 5-(carboxyamino)imidazole ribonucleotide mutase [Actinobacteria bacterium]|nr:5-(carboxyamino)imidazole ribonucleotide mutase [Actinomycetota bacterium]
MKKVAVVMGSISDEPVMKQAIVTLKDFGIECEVSILSAHRMPHKTGQFASNLKNSGIEVVIAGAGKAAHLAGVIASYTTVPVIGVPIKSPDLGGMDSLLSMVQMPSDVPVACMAINGSKNAAIFALQILALKYEDLREKLENFKKNLEY